MTAEQEVVAQRVIAFLRDRLAILTKPSRHDILDLIQETPITVKDLIEVATKRAKNT